LALVLAWGALAGAQGSAVSEAAQLTLTWVDTSGSTAGFYIERKTGTTGPYGRIAQQAPGAVSYIDGTVALGSTYCYRVQAFNSEGTSGYSNEACANPASLGVTVAMAGTGTGTVTSDPAGILCGADCSETYPTATVVTLTATPASGSNFSNWSNGCTGTGPCTITGNQPVLVTANFAAATSSQTRRLRVFRYHQGNITSSPSGITCPSTCIADYPSGTIITLTAVPETGKTFLGWKGAGCSGTGTCTITLERSRGVSARFSK
jgi:hypothetical protein